MTVQTFPDLLVERPFKPFRLVISSGQTYEVRHPEVALVVKSNILIGTDLDDENVAARFENCSMLHITAIEPLETYSNGTQG